MINGNSHAAITESTHSVHPIRDRCWKIMNSDAMTRFARLSEDSTIATWLGTLLDRHFESPQRAKAMARETS